MMGDGEFALVEREPSLEDYKRLRDAVGWGNLRDDRMVEEGLRNALFSVCALQKDEVVGFGRVIGDGGIYFYIQDIIVLPEFQGKGIGRRIMDAVMDYIAKNAGKNSFIGLMAAKGAFEFYEKYGFAVRPHDRPGMYRIW